MSDAPARPRVPERVWWIPFAAVAVVHLVVKSLDLVALDTATKPLLMVALALPILVRARRPPQLPTGLLLGGVLASWVGDVLIGWSFVAGLAAFLVAHLLYGAMFLTAFDRRPSRWAVGYAAWFAVFLVVLQPHLGGLLVPVVVYGVALGGMAALATPGGALTAIGGLCFVISDTLLALRRFADVLQDVGADVVTMAAYLAAQALLVAGVLRSRPEPRA
jgi:uncharacterized membrane protein YhhN